MRTADKMRILLWANHIYPAGGTVSTGLEPNPRATGGGSVIHDTLAKGLAQLGHKVFYMLPGADQPMPEGVTLVSEAMADVDIIHHYNAGWTEEPGFRRLLSEIDKPWVTTCHSDPAAWGMARRSVEDNWIFVSRTLARQHGSNRYVQNGIDPAQFRYSAIKADQFLFIAKFRPGLDKGLDLALELSNRLGFQIVVVGACTDGEAIHRIEQKCRLARATYVGDLRGWQKAERLTSAKALLFPTRTNEAFGLVMAEALASGTPVICSDRGACPEIISSDVGFVCRDMADYVEAVNAIEMIAPLSCRLKALREFHYIRMALDYVAEYEAELTGARRRIAIRNQPDAVFAESGS
jgi:glycosyltransferase involved in cell wall biosynthesis